MLARASSVLFLVGAVLGLVFASLSTGDFAQHLDRQVHAIHCSFVPGASASTDAESGCHVALMSPWSSVFRGLVWGGIPVALPGVAIFAFLLFRGLENWGARGLRDRQASLFLLATTLVPVATSVFFGVVAITQLDAFCKTCAGIYASSFLCLVGAIGIVAGTWSAGWVTPRDPDDADPPRDPEEVPPAPDVDHPAATWGIGAVELGGFVLAPLVLYVLAVPDHGKYAGTCGELATDDLDPKVLVPLERHGSGRQTIEVFDPLCPACKGFEARLASSGLAEQLDRSAVMFPLDAECNWMVTSSLHPGACTISEAVLCADQQPGPVIDWAFEHQEEIRAAAKDDPAAAKKLVVARFPELKSCVGSSAARQRLNRSLRWAVQNKLPVLTPQLYVEGVKLCDEDTDLGLDFALSRLLALGGRP